MPIIVRFISTLKFGHCGVSGIAVVMAAGEFSRLLVSHWRELHEKLRTQDEEIVIDGRSLSLAATIACAR